MRDLNHRAVLEYLAEHGPRSRVEIATDLSLSRPSVSRLVESLLGAGLVAEGRRVSSKAGRRRTLLGIRPEAAYVVGISLRPNRVRVRLADLLGRTRSNLVEATAAGGVTDLTAQLADMVARGVAASGDAEVPLGAVVVGITGAWDHRTRRVHAAPNLPVLEGVDFLAALEEVFAHQLVGGAPELDNEVNLAALGELSHGAARGTSSFFYLNLGSGIGGASVVNGVVHRGVQGFAGEVGYLPAPSAAGTVPLEARASRTALAATARALGVGDDASDLFDAAASGHEGAREAVRAFGADLTVAVCSVIATLDPELLVLGGSVGRFSDAIIPAIRDAMPATWPVDCMLTGTALQGDAAVVGAVSRALEVAREALISAVLP